MKNNTNKIAVLKSLLLVFARDARKAILLCLNRREHTETKFESKITEASITDWPYLVFDTLKICGSDQIKSPCEIRSFRQTDQRIIFEGKKLARKIKFNSHNTISKITGLVCEHT